MAFKSLSEFSTKALIKEIKIGSVVRLCDSKFCKRYYLVVEKPNLERWGNKVNFIGFGVFCLLFKTFGRLNIIENNFKYYDFLG